MVVKCAHKFIFRGIKFAEKLTKIKRDFLFSFIIHFFVNFYFSFSAVRALKQAGKMVNLQGTVPFIPRFSLFKFLSSAISSRFASPPWGHGQSVELGRKSRRFGGWSGGDKRTEYGRSDAKFRTQIGICHAQSTRGGGSGESDHRSAVAQCPAHFDVEVLPFCWGSAD